MENAMKNNDREVEKAAVLASNNLKFDDHMKLMVLFGFA
jgi:hypothetical protein